VLAQGGGDTSVAGRSAEPRSAKVEVPSDWIILMLLSAERIVEGCSTSDIHRG
jgi:hypothetical protein